MIDRFVAVPSFASRGAPFDAPPPPQSAARPSVERLALAAEFGPLARLVAAPEVTDVFVNGGEQVWVDRGDGLERADIGPLTAAESRDLAVRLVALGGRHVDEATPCIDVRLDGGVRVHAVLAPVAPSGALLSIRLPQDRRLDLDTLAAAGMFDRDPAKLDRLVRAVGARTNLLISGAGGSGKTTLLAALLGAAAPDERIVTIEDVAELRIDHPHVVGLQTRQANVEGAGDLGLDRLLRESLRMRPDRLVLGECRGAEVREMLAALNTGHDGGAGTLHANSLDDVPARLEALGALAGMSTAALARQAVSGIGLVLHVEREGGVRRVAAVGRLALADDARLVVRRESW
ncbi:pilus assembly protein CpaF [Labedella gwakjiensis]|uniref:Pilus assembly protein CpaF n=1 Tax=Labedella gwakjiensis TaxID=390269 RepID=A0A2P8GXH7_9MICO|nr:TadA family conjugal transfer-associated ATPase [Labedella gwakjiensis]PSL38680.1 pilus assembly protein CpaF [Labedella gwakjiensis]RUQ86824.1 TadA family conjugal transfer-associated ATPase [Labedella gwakjiensis]